MGMGVGRAVLLLLWLVHQWESNHSVHWVLVVCQGLSSVAEKSQALRMGQLMLLAACALLGPGLELGGWH